MHVTWLKSLVTEALPCRHTVPESEVIADNMNKPERSDKIVTSCE